MKNVIGLIREELLQLTRDYTFIGLMLLLLGLMTLACWNTHDHLESNRMEVQKQLDIVHKADEHLIAEIDSLSRGLANYEDSYTLPTNGIRLTYNNHRLVWLPEQPLSLVAIGQVDIYSRYKKIILYFNDSYEMSTKELESPIEQLFGQLDLAFVWVYLLPLIIVLISFNVLSVERESGRLVLIASQPLRIGNWLGLRLLVRFASLMLLMIGFTAVLLSCFGIPILMHIALFMQLVMLLCLYSAFWFFIGFLVNLLGYSTGKNLILLTSIWVLFIFLVPSAVNQLGKQLYPLPSRLEVINHHQQAYNQIEENLEAEKKQFYANRPDWYSDHPETKDMDHPTGWNIDYLAKQYMAQIKHQPFAEEYEQLVDKKNDWFQNLRSISPVMVMQGALADLAGSSTKFYRSYLRQSMDYATVYREYVFKGIFTNHAFTANEIRELPKFHFNTKKMPYTYTNDVTALLIYVVLVGVLVLILVSKSKNLKEHLLKK